MIQYICQICKTPFSRNPTKGRNPKYCSVKCYGIAQRLSKEKRNKDCKYCGKKFSFLFIKGRKDTREYCSQSCRGKDNIKKNIQRKLTGKILTCQNCDKEFYLMPKDIKRGGYFCCMACYQEAHRTTHKCRQCEKEFITPKFLSRKFCSRICLGLSQRTKNYEKNRNKQSLSDNRYSNWRIAIFEQDDYTCQLCKKKGGKLHAHHIMPWKLDAEHRYDKRNGATLCKPCHLDLHGKIVEVKKVHLSQR